MRKELGKWLMDIAKYVVTSVVLSFFFGEANKSTIYFVGLGISALALYLGLQMVKDKPPTQNNNENTNNQNT